MLIKKASWFVKEWNIFQVNDLYKVEESARVNDNNLLEENFA